MTNAVLDYPSGTLTGHSHSLSSGLPGRLWGLISLGGGTGSEPLWVSRARVVPAQGYIAADLQAGSPALLKEIRRISGLTLEELAYALDVSRRSLHNWDAGLPVRRRHLAALHLLAGLLRRLDSGNPIQMRNLLIMDLSGRNALAMIREGQLGAVEGLLASRIIRQPLPAALPEAEARKRRPQGIPMSAYDHEPVEVLPDRSLPRVKLPGFRKG